MIKKNLKIMIVTSIATILPILAGLIFWSNLPDKIPTHWNAAGEIDGWSSKPFAVFGLPLIMLAVHLFVFVVTLSDPKKQNHSQKVLQVIFWFVPALSIILSVFTYSAAMNKYAPVEIIMPVILGLLFVIIGNYLPKCHQNYTIGIKLPWTLDSEENWNRTHRLAGWLWVVGGIVMMISAFFNIIWIYIAISLIIILIPTVYSYILHIKGV